MSIKLEDIRLLVIQDLLGTLPDRDREILLDQLSERIEFREIDADIRKVLTPETIQYIKESNKKAAEKIIIRIHHLKMRRIIYVKAIKAGNRTGYFLDNGS